MNLHCKVHVIFYRPIQKLLNAISVFKIPESVDAEMKC